MMPVRILRQLGPFLLAQSHLIWQRSQSISGQESAVSMAVPYSRKVWILSIWRKKVWRINRLANRLLLVRCNNNNNYTDGFSLANHGRFAKLSRYSYIRYFIL